MSDQNRVGVLTISDTRDFPNDESGKILIEIIKKTQELNAVVCEYKIIPDTQNLIEDQLITWCDESKLQLILTTGGTGFAPRDVTPEATANVIEKEAPVLSLSMALSSLKITPFAVLSRAKCGIRKRTLIVNLPGSKKASVECFQAILPVVPHAIDTINDRKVSVSKTHAVVQKQFHHTCGNASSMEIPVAKRMRKSPYEMVKVDIALEMILSNVNVMETIFISYLDAMNYILAEDVTSKHPLPAFPASIKDGYALLADDTPGDLQILGAAVCGAPLDETNKNMHGKAVRITTGAPIPPGCDAVTQVEDTEVLEQSEIGEEKKVRILTKAKKNQDIRPIGTDVKAGECVLRKGTKLGPSEIGVLASIGKTEILVYNSPLIGVMSTGSELAEATKQSLDYGEIRDSNRISLLLLLKKYNFHTVDLGIIKDDLESLSTGVENALNKVDVLITTGGVSMGEKDYMKTILENRLKAKLHFGRLFMKPGKPTTFATCKFNDKNKAVFALPGNPASAMVTTLLFVFPALRKMKGQDDYDWTVIKAKLSQEVKLDPRPEYHRCLLQWKTDETVPWALSTGNQISSRLMSLKNSNGLMKLPPKSSEISLLNQGDTIDVLVVDNI